MGYSWEDLKAWIRDTLIIQNNKLNPRRNQKWIEVYYPDIFLKILSHPAATFTEKIYQIYYGLSATPQCCICGNSAKFQHFYNGYAKTCCSSSCKKEYQKLEENVHRSRTLLEKNRKKIQDTCIKRYGSKSPLSSPIVRQKIEDTCMQKYGFKNPSLSANVIKKIKSSKKYDYIHCFPDTFKILKIPKNVSGYVEFVCDEGHYVKMILDNWLRRRRCPKCNGRTSSYEKELLDILKAANINVIGNDKSVISPYEIDVYLPDYRVGIEINGLYWHNDDRIDKDYHLRKTLLCEKKNIRLLHVFEDEWLYKKNIVMSIIYNIIGRCSMRIYARQCDIISIDNFTKKTFLEQNHIQGNDTSSICYGLVYKDEIVSVMTFGKRKITGRPPVIEMMRFCNKINTTVIGGASRLFNHFIQNNQPDYVVSYADRRFFQGRLYNHLGFELKHIAKPNYWYIVNGKRQHRYGWRKQLLENKLEQFDASLSEYTNMKQNGYMRVWDCGNYVFEWKK